jgi:hypothetical protein
MLKNFSRNLPLFSLLAISVATIPAYGQVTLTHSEPETLEFSSEDCESTASETLTWELNASSAYYWRIMLQDRTQATNGEYTCPGIYEDGEILASSEDTLTDASNDEFNLSIDLSPSSLMGATGCIGAGERKSLILCFYLLESDLDVAFSDAIPLDFDSMVPGAPVISGVISGDQQVSLSLSNVDESAGDSYSFWVQYRSCTIGDIVDGGASTASADDAGTSLVYEEESLCGTSNPYVSTESTSSPVSISGLSNSVTYEIRVAVKDDFGNLSDYSQAALGAPQELLSPLNLYEGEPNPFSMEAPSCEATGGDLPLLFILLLLTVFFLAQRRDHKRSLAVLGLILCASQTAQAYPGQVTFGIKAGPYVPAIDSELSDGQPIYPIYRCFFDDSILPQIGMDLDVHLFDRFGSLEFGVGAAVSQAQGHVLELEAANPSFANTGTCAEPGDDTVELSILQLRPGLTYRLDPLLDYYSFPFVPYARVGLVGAGYAFTREGGFDESEASAGHNPIGMRFGYELAVGMMFALDFIDIIRMADWAGAVLDGPGSNIKSRRKKRRASVMEHVYVFSEVLTSQVDTFGQPGLVLTAEDRLFETNLPWTFNMGISMEFK